MLAAALRQQQYGAIQLDGPLDNPRRTEQFAPRILAAIRENYHPVFRSQDGAIYLPNSVRATRSDGGARRRLARESRPEELEKGRRNMKA